MFFPGLDLSKINLHPDTWAPSGFGAITFGDNVFFNPGEYDPTSIGGIAQIGHEVAHTRQYRHFGWPAFLSWYGMDGLRFGYDRIGLEREASAYERLITQSLQVEYGISDPCPPGECE